MRSLHKIIRRLLTLEPALLRAVLVAIAVVLGTVGLDATDAFERVNVAWAALFAVFPLVQGWWTRTAVTPNAAVVEQVKPSGVIVAGPANEKVRDGVVIRTRNEAVFRSSDDE